MSDDKPLLVFCEGETCRKCGNAQMNAQFMGKFSPGHQFDHDVLLVTCARCGFGFYRRPIDAEFDLKEIK